MKNFKKGFTLIELLVVITILGILATGAVATYTSQIQRARDTTRIDNILNLSKSIEIYYMNEGNYPEVNKFSDTFNYLNKEELKSNINNSYKFDPKGTNQFVFTYATGPNKEKTLKNQSFELSTLFESFSNIESRSGKDDGNDYFRYERGYNTNILNTGFEGNYGELCKTQTGYITNNNHNDCSLPDNIPSCGVLGGINKEIQLSTIEKQSDTIVFNSVECDKNLKYNIETKKDINVINKDSELLINKDGNCLLYFKNKYFIGDESTIDQNYKVKYHEKGNMCLLYSKLDNNILFNFSYNLAENYIPGKNENLYSEYDIEMMKELFE